MICSGLGPCRQSHPGKTFVARSGEVVHDRVISWGERSSHGPLSLKREMRDLDRRTEVAQNETRQAASLAERLASRIEDCERRKADLVQQLQDAEKEALVHDHGLRAMVAELERAEQRVRIAEGEIGRSADERHKLEEAMIGARSSLSEVSARTVTIEEELETPNEDERGTSEAIRYIGGAGRRPSIPDSCVRRTA